MRPDYLGVVFLTSAIVSFNGALWQISRRRQKKDIMESHQNLSKGTLRALPEKDLEAYSPKDIEFRRVELEGTFDNDGSVLVGPRSVPSYKGAANADEMKSGFVVMTPFEIAGTRQFLMVNRGWVPIDAGKHRRVLTQYIGEGFQPATLRGVFRREEYMQTFWSDAPENHAPMVADLSWLVIRPFDMLLEYYGKRWGPDAVEERKKLHGARHYTVEMIEDFSGDDQRMVRGLAWPRRKDTDELTYVHLTPMVHSMYAAFWLFVSLGSLYGLALCFKRQRMLFADRRRIEAEVERVTMERQREAKAYQAATQEVLMREEKERLEKLSRK